MMDGLRIDFEFLIPRRPVSVQTRRRQRLHEWKSYVHAEAAKTWSGLHPLNADGLSLTLVYLFDEAPIDVDNIVKPIQDALVGLVLEDDVLVSDVHSHRRPKAGSFDLAQLPALLIEGVLGGTECVYVRVGPAGALEDLL